MLFYSVFSMFAACLPHGRRKRQVAFSLRYVRAAGSGCSDSRRYVPTGEVRKPFQDAGGFRARFRADALSALEAGDDPGCSGSSAGSMPEVCGEECPDFFSWEGPGVFVLCFVFGCMLGVGILGMMLLFHSGGF